MEKPRIYYDRTANTGNIFYLTAVVRKILKDRGDEAIANSLLSTLNTECHSYEEALAVLGQYAELIDIHQEPENMASFVRKASDIEELRQRTSKDDREKEHFVIEKKVVLSKEDFDDLCDNFYEDRPYIKENAELMYKDESGWHCILVCTEGEDTGILIESEGYEYARYTALVKVSDVSAKGEE